jgi:predicted MFS family arabinose efflux permease
VINSIGYVLSAIGFSLITGAIQDWAYVSAAHNSREEEGVNLRINTGKQEEEFFQAWSFVRSHKVLVLALVTYALTVVPSQALAVIFLPFLKATYVDGEKYFGVLVSFFLMGNIISGMILTRWGRKMSMTVIFPALFSLPFIYLGYYYLHAPWVLFGLVLVNGALGIGLFTYVQSLFMKTSDPRYTGQVVGVFMTWHFGAEMVGTLCGGTLTQWFGFGFTFHAMFAVSLLGLLFTHRLYKREIRTVK